MCADFIDSNVFVHRFDETDSRKRRTAERLILQALEARSAAISFQVVQETLNVLVGKLRRPASHEDAQRFLEHGQRIEGLVIENPFIGSSSALR